MGRMQLRASKLKLALDLILIGVVVWILALQAEARQIVSYLFVVALLVATGIHWREYRGVRALEEAKTPERPDWDYPQAIQLLESWTKEAKAQAERRAKKPPSGRDRIASGALLLVAGAAWTGLLVLGRQGAVFLPGAIVLLGQGVITLSMGLSIRRRNAAKASLPTAANARPLPAASPEALQRSENSANQVQV